ncbi:MAG: hypothetical protein EKK34_10785 [Mycobacterium sp.]|nr:MAG: hypothetical protein EKK34_10785 [Mycobacterium sp.]
MSANVVYEIALYGSEKDNAPLLERVQLLSTGGVLRLHDHTGIETPCEGLDIAIAISSTASLWEVRAGENVRISCTPEIAAQLPFVLKPLLDGEDCSEHGAEVDGTDWIAYPTIDGDYVMLPGCDPTEGPYMSPCWAEHVFEVGESNPLIGYTSTGLATPAVVVDFGRYDHGGFGGGSAVSITPFDDFATV